MWNNINFWKKVKHIYSIWVPAGVIRWFYVSANLDWSLAKAGKITSNCGVHQEPCLRAAHLLPLQGFGVEQEDRCVDPSEKNAGTVKMRSGPHATLGLRKSCCLDPGACSWQEQLCCCCFRVFCQSVNSPPCHHQHWRAIVVIEKSTGMLKPLVLL